MSLMRLVISPDKFDLLCGDGREIGLDLASPAALEAGYRVGLVCETTGRELVACVEFACATRGGGCWLLLRADLATASLTQTNAMLARLLEKKAP